MKRPWTRPSYLTPVLVTLLAALSSAQQDLHEGPYLVWGDFDDDGLEDLYRRDRVGSDRLLRNAGDGTFEDVSGVALPEIGLGSSLATFVDVDEDGRLDLYLIDATGQSRLLHNTGLGAFEDVTLESALVHHEPARRASWRDYDGDGKPDLEVELATRAALFRNTGGGRFAEVDLGPLASLLPVVTGLPAGTATESLDPATHSPRTSPEHAPAIELELGAWARPGSSRSLPSKASLDGPLNAVEPLIGLSLDNRFVNDNAGEVDSADIADGSLTGADVSTSGGDVTFSGATVTASQFAAEKGVFGLGSSATGFSSTVSGGASNYASGQFSTVGGGIFNAASGIYSVISGGNGNSVSATGGSNTIGGGEQNRVKDQGGASTSYATVGGGIQNVAYFSHTTIGGGMQNLASGPYATVGGGYGNSATGASTTIGGGRRNTAASDYSAILGGAGNSADGIGASVGGGIGNHALGNYSFAAGRNAKAMHDGAFVWGDASESDAKLSQAPNTFTVHASGGSRFYSDTDGRTGVGLASGSGSWSTLSDRDSKENLVPTDVQRVLERVLALPVFTWNYKAQSDTIRHMGPMAQDFRAAFDLGVSERMIDTVDPDGVALAAIQGLHHEMETMRADKEAEIASIQAELSALREQVAALVASKTPSR